MLTDRNKRVLICELEPETVLDLLKQLPKRLLQEIVMEFKLMPVDDSKAALVLVVTEHRKEIFKSLKFTLSYAKRH
jgi:molybdopterin synthase catalytic subunit